MPKKPRPGREKGGCSTTCCNAALLNAPEVPSRSVFVTEPRSALEARASSPVTTGPTGLRGTAGALRNAGSPPCPIDIAPFLAVLRVTFRSSTLQWLSRCSIALVRVCQCTGARTRNRTSLYIAQVASAQVSSVYRCEAQIAADFEHGAGNSFEDWALCKMNEQRSCRWLLQAVKAYLHLLESAPAPLTL